MSMMSYTDGRIIIFGIFSWIRVTSYGENTNGHPAVIAKYPRFAHKVERQ